MDLMQRFGQQRTLLIMQRIRPSTPWGCFSKSMYCRRIGTIGSLSWSGRIPTGQLETFESRSALLGTSRSRIRTSPLCGPNSMRLFTAEAKPALEEEALLAVDRDSRQILGDKLATLVGESVSKPKDLPKTAKKTKTKKKAESESKAMTEEANAIVAETKKKAKRKSAKDKKEPAAQTMTQVIEEATSVAATKTRKTSKRKSKKDEENLATSIAPGAGPSSVTQLRPYQKECIETCLANLKKGIMRQVVSLPVGSGKTVIFSHLMKQVPAPFPGATKTLILAHRQELLQQTRNHVLRSGTGLSVSMDQGSKNADMTADVIVASVPSLGREGTPRILKYNPKEFKTIIIDEAHHAAAESYGRILSHFGADNPDTHIFVYGCSATVRRHDGLMLSRVFDYISFHKSFITMIEDKWLCGLRVTTVKTELDLQEVKTRGGDFVQKDLANKVNTPARNEVVVRSYMTYANERKSTVVFAVDIEHVHSLTEAFRQYGYDARALSSKTGDDERAQLLKDFRDQKFPIIVNCGILTEGTDIPVIDSILMARPTKSNVLFLQMLGRGMRLYPGKSDCLVLDFVDVIRGEGLVTLPTLLGLDPEAVLNKEIKAIEEEPSGSEFPEETESETVVDPNTGAKVARIRVLEYDNPYQIIGDCSGIPNRLWDFTSNAWVHVGPDAYVLATKAETFRIDKSLEDGLYRCRVRQQIVRKDVSEATVTSAKNGVLTFRNNYAEMARQRRDAGEKGDKLNFFLSKGKLLPIETDSLRECIHGVDTYITRTIGHKPFILGRFAKWRKLPATDSQIRFLHKLGYGDDHGEEGSSIPGDKVSPQSSRKLTKGQAANMITRLTNGAGKRWEESKKFRIKKAKEIAKEIGVDVGPIPKLVNV
ncbi:hypothetical protein BGW38_007776 [Lunasporangiospora selenospora]|uniref:Superfamily II DNA or RNA helicase n=1 Tax=Lunasporangiospora selenospora TaxID=979761 RepID=A0A9P6FY59_9FUNG|nr:hypothetical protein BGW38_007776 [Lunasporangiospora selenospora]